MSHVPLRDLFDLSGKTTIVTGGAMGIGYGIVTRFREAGANVVIADIDAAVGLEKAKQSGSTFIQTDVSDESAVANLFAKTIQQFGTVDLLINNAGIFPSVPTTDMTVELWDKIQAINLRGAFLCSREAAKIMKEKKAGTIINIASIDALHPSQVGLAAYDASKHGMWGFTKSLALELGRYGVRVNAIAPGGINTEGVAKLGDQAAQAGINMDEVMKSFMAKIPLQRMGEPDEIALPTLFLATEAARYITGEIIVVDGGALLA